MSVVLISHDMGVIAEFARRVIVMYAAAWSKPPGCRAVSQPLHPYTEGLLAAIPKLDIDVDRLADHQGAAFQILRRPSRDAAIARGARS